MIRIESNNILTVNLCLYHNYKELFNEKSSLIYNQVMIIIRYQFRVG